MAIPSKAAGSKRSSGGDLMQAMNRSPVKHGDNSPFVVCHCDLGLPLFHFVSRVGFKSFSSSSQVRSPKAKDGGSPRRSAAEEGEAAADLYDTRSESDSVIDMLDAMSREAMEYRASQEQADEPDMESATGGMGEDDDDVEGSESTEEGDSETELGDGAILQSSSEGERAADNDRAARGAARHEATAPRTPSPDASAPSPRAVRSSPRRPKPQSEEPLSKRARRQSYPPTQRGRRGSKGRVAPAPTQIVGGFKLTSRQTSMASFFVAKSSS